MNIAITTWEDRISPVFDSSNTLLVARIEGAKVTEKHLEFFYSQRPSQLVARLKELQVSVLICGAISMDPATVIEIGGIQLIPFIGGMTAEVLDAFARDLAIVPDFLLPGCSGGCSGGVRRQNALDVKRRGGNTMPGKNKTGSKGQGAGKGRGKGQGRCNSGQGNRGACRSGNQTGGRKGQGAKSE